MRTWLVRFVTPLMLLILVARPELAEAKKRMSRAKIRAAKKAFRQGQGFFKKSQYGPAIVEFMKAHEITKDGLVMGQVALAFEKAGDYKRALEAIMVYRNALPESDRGSADELVTRYKGLIAAGKSKHLRLPGEVAPAPVPPPKPKVEPKPEAKPIKDPAPVTPKRKKRFWTWVAAGGAGAVAVGAIVLGLSASSSYSELEDSCGKTGSCTDDQVSDVRSKAVATDVLWATAIAAGVTAGVLFFLEGRGESATAADDDDDEEDTKTNDDEEEDDDGDLVKGFSVAPIVGSGTYGVGAAFRF